MQDPIILNFDGGRQKKAPHRYGAGVLFVPLAQPKKLVYNIERMFEMEENSMEFKVLAVGDVVGAFPDGYFQESCPY